MIDANSLPSSSRLTRVATGVDPAKNFVQLAFIWACALPVAGDEDVGVAAGDEEGVDGGVLELVDGLLLPQAATKPATAHAPMTAAICLLLFMQLFSNSRSGNDIPRPAVVPP
jgi:hypothetical protein